MGRPRKNSILQNANRRLGITEESESTTQPTVPNVTDSIEASEPSVPASPEVFSPKQNKGSSKTSAGTKAKQTDALEIRIAKNAFDLFTEQVKWNQAQLAKGKTLDEVLQSNIVNWHWVEGMYELVQPINGQLLAQLQQQAQGIVHSTSWGQFQVILDPSPQLAQNLKEGRYVSIAVIAPIKAEGLAGNPAAYLEPIPWTENKATNDKLSNLVHDILELNVKAIKAGKPEMVVVSPSNYDRTTGQVKPWNAVVKFKLKDDGNGTIQGSIKPLDF